MNNQNVFIRLIDEGILIIQGLLGQSAYSIYFSRYKRMIANLEDLKIGIQKGILSENFIYLGVTQMLNDNDPKQLENVILAINKFYCENFREFI